MKSPGLLSKRFDSTAPIPEKKDPSPHVSSETEMRFTLDRVLHFIWQADVENLVVCGSHVSNPEVCWGDG